MGRPSKGHVFHHHGRWTVLLRTPKGLEDKVGYKSKRIGLQSPTREDAELEALHLLASHRTLIVKARSEGRLFATAGMAFESMKPGEIKHVEGTWKGIHGRYAFKATATEIELIHLDTLTTVERYPNGRARTVEELLNAELRKMPPAEAERLAHEAFEIGEKKVAAKREARRPKGKTISALAAEFHASRTLAIATKRAWDQSLRLFIDKQGDLEIDKITRAVAAEFYRELPGKQATRNKLLTALSTIANFGVRQGDLETNPFSGVADKTQIKKETETANPFSPEELKAYFAKIERDGTTAVWVSRLLLYTGARLEEMAQLRTEWIKEIDGIMCIDLRSAKTKNRESQRIVPIHARLIELGFLKFVRSQKSEMLFSDLKEREGRFSFALSRDLNRRVKAACPDAVNLRVHSFRSTFKVKGAQAGVEKAILDIIQGHRPGDVSAGVYMKALANNVPHLKSQIDRITFQV